MDSVDFSLEGKRSISKRGPKWSFKKNSPDQRFMFLRDGKGKVIKKWSGYSPKLYDGNWLQANKEWLESELEGGVIVADNHFMWGKKNLKKVRFHSNSPEQRCCQEDDNDFIENIQSSKKQSYNRAVRNARARIENLFGQMTTLFQSLAKPWGSKEEQQNYQDGLNSYC